MRHEQFNYMERVVSKALSEDSLRYGNPQIDYIKDTLNGCDHEGIVDVEYFVSELENMRNSCDKVIRAIAEEQQAQQRLHNDKFINRATGEKW
jgi:hypothetical protein